MNTVYIILISIAVLGLCVFGLCFNIIFRKDGKFPETEFSRNKEMRKRGILCMREQDEQLWGKSTHIRVTSKKGKLKTEPDENCTLCDQTCALKDLIGKR